MSQSRSPAIPPPAEAWGEIEPSLLEDARGPVPAFPLELLPPFWRDWVAATARSAGAPIDHVALSVLAAVAGLAGARAQVRLTPHWVEPLVLWLAMIGAPSSGKSAAMAPLRDLLLALEPRAPVDRAPIPPLVVEDGGIDEVAAALEAHPRGVILWRDEPADLLARLGAEPGRRGDEALRACWLQAWSGGPVTPGKGARRLTQFPVSLLLALRPERLAELLGAGDALAGRFLFTWPHAAAHVPLAARPRRRDDEVALGSLRRIADRLSGDPLDLALDDGGLAAFDGFTARLQAERGGAEGLESALLGKGAGTAARLAGVLQVLEWSRDLSPATPAAIGRESVERAIALWSGYFRPHALALFHRMAPTEQDRRARQVVRWLRQLSQRHVSREDIRCKALSRSVDAQGAEQILAGLQQAGVVERASGESPTRGRPTSHWWINPALLENASTENTENRLAR